MLYVGRTAAHGYHIETEIVGSKGALRISPVPQKNLVQIYGNGGVLQECVEGFLERFQDRLPERAPRVRPLHPRRASSPV